MPRSPWGLGCLVWSGFVSFGGMPNSFFALQALGKKGLACRMSMWFRSSPGTMRSSTRGAVCDPGRMVNLVRRIYLGAFSSLFQRAQ